MKKEVVLCAVVIIVCLIFVFLFAPKISYKVLYEKQVIKTIEKVLIEKAQ